MITYVEGAPPPPAPKIFSLLNLDPVNPKQCTKYDDDAVLEAIHQNPNAVKTKYRFSAWCNLEHYPLPMAIALGSSSTVVRVLCDVCPEAIHTMGIWGWLPLHFACNFRAPLNVCLLLATKYPAAIETLGTNWYGHSPVHLACRSGSVELVRLLIELCPLAMALENKRGDMPTTLARGNVEVTALFDTMHALLHDPGDDELMDMLRESEGSTGGVMWTSRVGPILHSRPCLVHTMGINSRLMPLVLARIGHGRRTQTMYGIVRETMSLFSDVRVHHHATQTATETEEEVGRREERMTETLAKLSHAVKEEVSRTEKKIDR